MQQNNIITKVHFIGISGYFSWLSQQKAVPLYQRGQPVAIDRRPDRKASLCETE